MQKTTLAILLITIALFTACKKKEDPKMEYTFNGLTDYTVKQYLDTSISMAFSTTYESGPQEAVTITPTNLPSGVTVTPAFLGGTPSFGAIFTFKIKVNTSGTFPINFDVVDASGNKKTFSFNLNISPVQLLDYSFSVSNMSIAVSSLPATVPLNIPVTYISGVNENVTVKLDSLPSGIAVLPASVTSMPSFTANFPLFHVDAGTPAGNYTIIVKSASPSTDGKRKTFTLTLY
jgi:hypothetical protein